METTLTSLLTQLLLSAFGEDTFLDIAGTNWELIRGNMDDVEDC